MVNFNHKKVVEVADLVEERAYFLLTLTVEMHNQEIFIVKLFVEKMIVDLILKKMVLFVFNLEPFLFLSI